MNNPEFNQQSGRLGDFFIQADGFVDSANSMGMSSLLTSGDDVRFWAGAAYADRATAPFRVTRAGLLYATGATISGTITATTGTIGGFTIGATTLSAGTGNGKITLDSAGISSFGTAGAGNFFTQISSGYSGSGGSFITKYDTKYLVQIDTNASGTVRGEIALYDSSENLNLYLSGLGFVRAKSFITDPAYTVGTLPAAGTSAGMRTFVSDALVALSVGIGAVVAAGGTEFSPVYSDGANWRQG